MKSVLAGAFAATVIICAQPAASASIDAHVVSCVGDFCTAALDGGPVPVDPGGFTHDGVRAPIGALDVQFDLDPPAKVAIAPEPPVLAVIAIAAVALIARQFKRLRRTRSARLH